MINLQSERRFRTLIENSRDAILLADAGGNITYANPSVGELLGYTPETVMAMTLWDLIHPENNHFFEKKLGQAENETTAPIELRLQHQDSSWLWFECSITNLLHEPAVEGIILNLRDVTEQRKLEHQREELTDMIVHDLRNPASAVAGIVSMLKSLNNLDEIPADFDQMMQLAERNVTKLLELIQEILDVSKLENGQLPVNKAPLRLEQLIEETIQLQRPIITLKEMNLVTDIEPDIPQVYADERLIRRVLQNLVDNAAKFSRRNSRINISAKISAEDPSWVQVSVQDFGVGIPPELQNLVFEKFVTNRQIERGSGIGLTFCRLAVLAHDGRIWAESEENLGSTFHFTLPVSPN